MALVEAWLLLIRLGYPVVRAEIGVVDFQRIRNARHVVFIVFFCNRRLGEPTIPFHEGQVR